MKNPKIRLSFEKGILIVTYEEDAVVDVDDIKEIYDRGFELSERKKFCIIFHTLGQFKVTREAWDYAVDSPNNERIYAKAYVTDSPESESKAVFHIRMDKPQLTPMTFWNLKAAKKKMQEILAKESGSK
jgi:hypothetical protein